MLESHDPYKLVLLRPWRSWTWWAKIRAGHPVESWGGGRDNDWRHDVIPALGTISCSSLHLKILILRMNSLICHPLKDSSPWMSQVRWLHRAGTYQCRSLLGQWRVQTLLGMTLPKLWCNTAALAHSCPISASSLQWAGKNMILHLALEISLS